ncbi:hypothetical protein PR048_008699 [Dryococelus australis]|uniref:Uncharacterized protein n=1 Tax=Dryococelus australis TaxID=614101 RepID=A0ABQ9HXV5_9NEOP|nr:hypothetical protein PR048_008699 [Dryococelus australis]
MVDNSLPLDDSPAVGLFRALARAQKNSPHASLFSVSHRLPIDTLYCSKLEFKGGETGDPREKLPINSIVRHDSHFAKIRSDLDGDESTLKYRCSRNRVLDTLLSHVRPPYAGTGLKYLHEQYQQIFKQTSPTANSLTPQLQAGRSGRRSTCSLPQSDAALKNTSFRIVIRAFADVRTIFLRHLHTARPSLVSAAGDRAEDATVAERLARSPPTKGNRVQNPAGLPDFLKWESCQTMPWSADFLGDLPFPPPLHSGTAQ